MLFQLLFSCDSFADHYDSRQIRPPIYSLKQTKLRKRRVTRYAILYFTMFILFMALTIAPALLGNQLTAKMSPITLGDMILSQPTNWNNNDTSGFQTGTGNATNDQATATDSSSGASATDSSSSGSGSGSGGDDAAAAAAAAAAAGARRVRRAMFSYNDGADFIHVDLP